MNAAELLNKMGNGSTNAKEKVKEFILNYMNQNPGWNKVEESQKIRNKDNIDKPYVTLELKNKKIIQVRGYKNNVNNPLDEQVKTFVNHWRDKFKLTGLCY